MREGLVLLMIFDVLSTRHTIIYVCGTERLKLLSCKDDNGGVEVKTR